MSSMTAKSVPKRVIGPRIQETASEVNTGQLTFCLTNGMNPRSPNVIHETKEKMFALQKAPGWASKTSS